MSVVHCSRLFSEERIRFRIVGWLERYANGKVLFPIMVVSRK